MKARKSLVRRAKAKATREPRADGEATRRRIVETAGRLFAVAGYANTAAKLIAKRAKVSLASINYYFDGRQGLYRAVLVEAHGRVISLTELVDLADSDLSAPAKLKVFIEQLVRQATNREAGWHMDVLAREILAPSPNIRALTQTAVPPKLEIIMQVLSEISGIPPSDPALSRCSLSALTPCTVLLLMARGIPGPLHDIRQMPIDVITNHLHIFALAGLEAIGRDYRRRTKLEN